MYYLKPYHEMLGFSALMGYPNIFHFTTTRNGGVSTGNYATLNGSIFSGDETNAVQRNWERILSYSPIQPLCIVRPYQTHDNLVYCIDEEFLSCTETEQGKLVHGVDALITNLPRVLITVATADCVPITLYDPIRNVIAVVHAGWRGTVKRVLAKTTQRMIEVYQSNIEDIKFCIGPSISLENFEVGEEVVEEFRKANFSMNNIVRYNPTTAKNHIDLWAANAQQVEELGALKENIYLADKCTYREHDEFFSARRLGIASGRIITGIMLNE